MPDLTIEPFWCCESLFGWQRVVLGSKLQSYVVTWGRQHKAWREVEYDYACTCKAYQMRPGYCKHIEAVKGEHCRWDAWQDGGAPDDGRCPRCGGPVMSHNVGV